MTTETPVLVAHRGLAASWPENTIPALEAAVAAGADWVEVDVQLCADGVPVVLHDADLARTGGLDHSVFELTAAELGEFAVGEPGRFGARFAHVRVPTLAAFAEWLAAHPALRAFVELKPESIERFGRPAVVQACLDAMQPARGQWAPISFDYEALALAADAGVELLGWVIRDFDPAVADRARALPARWLFRNHERLAAGPLPPGPWTWVLYEVEDADTARALLGRGTPWLETMDYAALRAALRSGGT